MAMKICKECGTEISGSAKVCPKCGKEQRNFFMKHKGITFILVLVVLGVIVGSTGDKNNNKTSQTSSTNIVQEENETTPVEKFSLVSDEMIKDSFSTYIEGTIQNNKDKDCTYVQVTFNLFDAEGNQLGTAVDNINNLKANGTWKYKAVALTNEDIASYELAEITGW